MFLKNQKLAFPVLVFMFMFIFILAFQNCARNENKNDGPADKASGPEITDTTTTTTLSNGDKAVFKLSEKYGGEAVSNISWQTYRKQCGKSEIAFETGLNIQIPWNNQSGSVATIAGSSFNMLALVQVEQCLIYRHFRLDKTLFSNDYFVDRSSCMPSSGDISFSLSDDASVKRNYFPVGSAVNLEFSPSEGSNISLENESFQWSVKKVGDDTELADQTHTSSELTHTFSQMGLYSVSVKSSSTSSLRDDKELLIGLCEEEVEAVEVILGQESFGDSTPERVLNSKPIFNYVRPADTDTNNKVTFVFDDNSENYQDQHITYKYKRSSSSKFIDIDIQNADECFFDAEPIIGRSCPSCAPGATDCSCSDPVYAMNENLSPLSSCSGDILDMSTSDTDSTQCTDATFVVIASKTGQDKIYEIFYKHCPADQDYCYFGYEKDRPNNYSCFVASG